VLSSSKSISLSVSSKSLQRNRLLNSIKYALKYYCMQIRNIILCEQNKHLRSYMFLFLFLYLFAKKFSIIVKRIGKIIKFNNEIYCFNRIKRR